MHDKREQDLRMNLAKMDHNQLIDTCVQMQGVIDTHVAEKGGFTSSINSLNKRCEMLEQEVARLEGELGEDAGASKVEMDALREENDRLKERNEKLQTLNEKYQEKLFDKV